jgi:hypothetical protein
MSAVAKQLRPSPAKVRWQDSNLQSLLPKTHALSIRQQGLLLERQFAQELVDLVQPGFRGFSEFQCKIECGFTRYQIVGLRQSHALLNCLNIEAHGRIRNVLSESYLRGDWRGMTWTANAIRHRKTADNRSPRSAADGGLHGQRCRMSNLMYTSAGCLGEHHSPPGHNACRCCHSIAERGFSDPAFVPLSVLSTLRLRWLENYSYTGARNALFNLKKTPRRGTEPGSAA